MSLQGKVAFIAAGAKNLGALIATMFAAEGADLAIHYHSASVEKGANELQATIKSKYPNLKVRLYQADMTSAKEVTAVYADILKDFNGKLDIVVNCVGMVLKKPLVEITEQEYDAMFAINSKAAFFITQEAAKHVADGGKIINILTSLLAAYTPMYTSYQASKASVEWFTKGLAKELMPRGISVTNVAPGPMDTPFFYAQETEQSVVYLKSGALGGRLTQIEDIAPLVTFLVTQGGWINGRSRPNICKQAFC